MDAGGAGDFWQVLEGRESQGQDVGGAGLVVRKLETGIMGGQLGCGTATVGGSTAWETTGRSRGGAGGVADDGAPGRNERRLKEYSVVCRCR